jgi:hypothetical protein
MFRKGVFTVSFESIKWVFELPSNFLPAKTWNKIGQNIFNTSCDSHRQKPTSCRTTTQKITTITAVLFLMLVLALWHFSNGDATLKWCLLNCQETKRNFSYSRTRNLFNIIEYFQFQSRSIGVQQAHYFVSQRINLLDVQLASSRDPSAVMATHWVSMLNSNSLFHKSVLWKSINSLVVHQAKLFSQSTCRPEVHTPSPNSIKISSII